MHRFNLRWSIPGAFVGGVFLIASIASSTGCSVGRCPGFPVDERLKEAPEMVEDGRLIGLTRVELEQRLGKLHEGKTFSGFDEGYYLGADSSCIDSRWLVFRFDETGRVEVASLYGD